MPVELKYYEGNNRDSKTSNADKWPDTCPICHHSIKSIGISGVRLKRVDISSLEIVFQCPRNDCGSLFLSYYTESGSIHYEFTFKGSAPATPRKREFESAIQELSEKFTTIFNQAKRAEELGLEWIAGMGYRRAFEFLIKDFLISKLPEKEQEIKQKMLGLCIKTYITDERIKKIAERAAWLGNDETHYERRRTDKDIEDLKMLIEITVHYITMDTLAERYIDEMQ